MTGRFARALREPLVRFLLLAAAIFAVGGRGERGPAREIRIGAGEIAALAEGWRAQHGTAPTRAQLEAAIALHVDEEMRYREALALGLDRDDTIVRRRLVQKYEFLMGAGDGEAAPSEEDLRALHESDPSRYAAPARASFCQVFFGDAGAGGYARAREALSALGEEAKGEEGALVDTASLLDTERCMAADEDAIARRFGRHFGASLAALPAGEWSGPVESGFGAHLVYLRSRAPAAPLSLARARERLLEDWTEARRARRRAAMGQALEAQYRVRIDAAALESAAPANDVP